MKRLLAILLFVLVATPSFAAQRLEPLATFLKANGLPAASYKLFTYNPGTQVKKTVYKNATLSTAYTTNPIILNTSGRPPGNYPIYFSGAVKYVLAPSTDSDPPIAALYTVDNYNGSGVTNEYTLSGDFAGSLSSAATYLNTLTADCELIIDQDFTMTASVSFDAEVHLTFAPGNVITTTGYTLTIGGSIEAGSYQIFAGTGTVTGLKEARPEWWYSSGTYTSAFHSAIDSFGTRPGIIKCSNKTYTVPALVVDGRVTIEGSGTALEDETASSYGTRLEITGDIGIRLETQTAKLKNLTVFGAASNTAYGVWFLANANCLDNVSIMSMGDVGLKVGSTTDAVNTNSWRLYNVTIRDCVSHGAVFDDNNIGAGPDCNAGSSFGLICQNNGGDGLRIDNAEINNFYGLKTESNTGYGVRVMSNAQYNSFWGTHSEGNASDFVFEVGSLYNSISGSINYTPVDNGSNLILMFSGGNIVFEAGGISAPGGTFTIKNTAIGAGYNGLYIKDPSANRVAVGYGDTSILGSKNVPVQLMYSGGLVGGGAGSLEIGSRGTVASDIAFFTSPDAGTTGLVESMRIKSTGEVKVEKIFSFSGTPQSLSGAGAINATTYCSELTTTGANAITIANGATQGQQKMCVMVNDGGDGTLSGANIAVPTSIVFNDVNDTVFLEWSSTLSKWVVKGYYGVTIS